MGDAASRGSVFRILDANANRLREALRVVEEYFRFAATDAMLASDLKRVRHGLQVFEEGVGRADLLAARDTARDPFAPENSPEETGRGSVADVARASLKRGQEAARVLEEYVKVLGKQELSQGAKEARFLLYRIEKRLMERSAHG